MYARSTSALSRAITIAAIAVIVAACASEAPGWTFAPPPSPTPVPSVEPGASGPAPSGPAESPAGSPAESPADSPAGDAIRLTASGVAYDKSELSVPAGQPFAIAFDNEDASIPHNVAIHESSPTGPEVWKGEVFDGVETRTYDVPALAAGTYGFVCTVHPNMTGTLTAG